MCSKRNEFSSINDTFIHFFVTMPIGHGSIWTDSLPKITVPKPSTAAAPKPIGRSRCESASIVPLPPSPSARFFPIFRPRRGRSFPPSPSQGLVLARHLPSLLPTAARPATAIRTMSLSATGNYTRRVAAGVEIPSDDIEKIWKHCQLIFVMMTW